MQQRFLQQITLRRRVNSYRRWWAAAVLIPFIFLCGSVWFLADKVGLFSETEYAELVVPCGEQMRVVLQDGTIVQLNSDTRLKYPKSLVYSTVRWNCGEKDILKWQRRRIVRL